MSSSPKSSTSTPATHSHGNTLDLASSQAPLPPALSILISPSSDHSIPSSGLSHTIPQRHLLFYSTAIPNSSILAFFSWIHELPPGVSCFPTKPRPPGGIDQPHSPTPTPYPVPFRLTFSETLNPRLIKLSTLPALTARLWCCWRTITPQYRRGHRDPSVAGAPLHTLTSLPSPATCPPLPSPQWLGSSPTEKIEVVRHALPQFHTLLPRKLLPLPLSLSLSLQCQKKRRFPPFQGYWVQPAVSSETCFVDKLSNLSSFFPPPLAASPKQTCSGLFILKHPSVCLSLVCLCFSLSISLSPLSHCLSLSLSIFLSPPSHWPSRTHTHLTAPSTLHQLSPSGTSFPPFPLFLLRDRLLGRVLTSSPPFTPKPPPPLFRNGPCDVNSGHSVPDILKHRQCEPFCPS